MRIDPRHLRVAEAVRLLNATPLGEVVQPHVIYRHLNRAAHRISPPGDVRRVDLLRYAAWLFWERRQTESGGSDEPGLDYARHKDAVNARNRLASESSRDIASEGWVHPPVNAERKEQCRRSFRGFCEAYFPLTFHLAWSPDHLKVIAKIETAVLEGGLFAMAMPRGSGKTTLCETACLWALLYGHREFVTLIGADEDHAADMLDAIKSELENNDLLEEDFSEVCGPIRALEGIHQRAAGQLYQGARTHVGWTAKEIVLPTTPGSASSGAIIKVAGITGRIRGMKHKRADGKSVRPSLVLLDDPQTDESARSPSQCATREQILAGAILGLAGPGRKIAGLMTLTVVLPGDMADRLLDPEKHPQWQGERTRMVYAFPSNEKLWQQYAQVRAEGQRAGRGTAEATEFYRTRREDMDAGAKVAWPQRFNPDELSAIQHAMNLKLDQGEAAFWAEYQNQPLEVSQEDDLLDADAIANKTNGMKRGEVPVAVNHLTMFVDVQGSLLFWMVCGWEDGFTGYVLDYGAYPDQKRPYFTLRDARRTLMGVHKGTGQEGAIYAGLEALTTACLCRQFRRDDGADMRIERCLIDANWGNSTDVVYQFCRQSPHAAMVMPSHGRYVGASSVPFGDYKPKRGDRVGLHWRIPGVQGKRATRHVIIDTNYWKSFVHARLAVPMADPGCLSLFAPDAACGGGEHRQLAEHLTAEYRVKTQGRGREVDEWKLRLPGAGRDNHWLDCLVGCAVGASMQGCVLFGTDERRTTA
ncbi:MAG: phage terminase large subunit family protein, partial [Phycisphaeraceae bacterium]|nr:phage terminase large subunit family protein [Phycisphaeraceae bacterium]